MINSSLQFGLHRVRLITRALSKKFHFRQGVGGGGGDGRLADGYCFIYKYTVNTKYYRWVGERGMGDGSFTEKSS